MVRDGLFPGATIQFMSSLEHLRARRTVLGVSAGGVVAEDKYRLVSLYDDCSQWNEGQVDKRVYIDLLRRSWPTVKSRHTTVLKGSPILALEVPNPFDKYIFCEESDELWSAT